MARWTNPETANMTEPKETFEDRIITYTLQVGERFILIEYVPCRVCLETGEQLFSPETAEWIRQTVSSHQKPVRVIETEVFDFADRMKSDHDAQNPIRMGA